VPELRNVNPQDAIAAFQRAGGIVRRGKGSHINVKMPNGLIITISGGRRPVKIGILRSAIRKAGLTEEEFVRLLEG
jgi:predicted RNA binding protein YcfA (HicA-like mRNA interferase family)